MRHKVTLFTLRLFALALLAWMPTVGLQAQRLQTAYTFSTGVDSTKWIALDSTAQNLLALNATRSAVQNIGFPFTYAGEEYTSFSISKYGYLRFGNTLLPNSQQQYPLGSPEQARIRPCVVGLVGYSSIQIDTASYARSQVVGDTGSRVLVVELKAKVMDFRYPAYDYAHIQIQLHEASQAVCIVYGAQPTISLYSGYQIGFVGRNDDVAFIDVDSSTVTFANSTNQLNDTLSFPQQWRWYQLEYDSNYCYHYATPWGEDFNTNDYLGCWSIMDYDANAGSSWYSEGPRVRVNYGTYTSNNWLVTPPILLPATDDGLRLTYDYQTSGTTTAGKMHVRIAAYYPGDPVEVVDTIDFFTTLRTETQPFGQFTQRAISLAGYAGMQVRIAFVAVGLGPNNHHSRLDNVLIQQTTTPVISVEAPSRAFAHDTTTLTAHLIEGSELGITYSWHSTMAADSMATLMPNGAQLNIVYTHYGSDTITCIASNVYGSDTTSEVVDVRDCSTVTEYPWMDGFEHGLDCWTVPLSGWTLSSGYGIPSTYEGDYVLRGGHDQIISQPFAIPTPDKMPDPEVMWWMRTPSMDTYSHNIFRLYIVVTDSAGNYSSYGTLVLTDTLQYGPWKRYRLSLAPYAGQTIRLRFNNTPSSGAISYYDCVVIDQMEVRSTAVPVIELPTPPRLDRLDSISLAAHLEEGDTAGLTFSWHSTMASDSLATFTANDTLLNITYAAEGIDTITIVATNNYGSDTATVIVPIYNCPAQSLPFVADFEDSTALSCWSGFTSNSNNETRTSYGTTWYWAGDGSNHYMASNTYHSWLVTPAIDIPEDTSDLYMSWHHTGNYMWVYVATGDGYFEPADFGSTLFSGDSETPGSQRLSLAAYAGQRIHVGFFCSYSTGNHLDSVRISYNDQPPQAVITGPDSSYARGRVALTATLNRCSHRNLTHTWHSTMVAAGLARATTDNGQCAIYYLDGGVDTVTYIASNLYGADTQQVVIVVDACNAYAVPYTIDFDSLTGAEHNRAGILPTCWSYLWNGKNDYRPHVLNAHASPLSNYSSQAAIIIAGNNTSSLAWWDTVAYLVLPRFADNLYNLSLALTHVHENVLHGTLTVGYMVDTVFMPIQTLPAVAGSGQRDTVNFASVPDGATHMALRWHNTGIWYSVLIDDIEVFVPSPAGMPPTITLTAPDSALTGRPALFSATLRTGDTTGLSYSWHSTMAATGYANAVANDNQYSITYNRNGYDTVTLIATNPFGADTQRAVVEVITYYTVTAMSVDDGMGTVTGGGNYREGDTATLTATANEGFYFVGWNDGDTLPIRRIVVTSDSMFIAYFRALPIAYYTVTAVSADSTMGTVTGSGMYPEGDTATLTAIPNEGYHFVRWNDGDSAAQRQIIVAMDTLFTAYFAQDTLPTGIRPTSAAPQYKLYPNPATRHIVVSIGPDETLPVAMTLIDMTGRAVLQTVLTAHSTTLDVSHLPTGHYFVHLETSAGGTTRKLTIIGQQ